MKVSKLVLVCWLIAFLCLLFQAVSSRYFLSKSWEREEHWKETVERCLKQHQEGGDAQ